MKQHILCLMALLGLLFLPGCSKSPVEETTMQTLIPSTEVSQPEETIPDVLETTVPPTTEPAVQNPPVREIDTDNALMIDAGFEMIQGDPYLDWFDSLYEPIRCRFRYAGDEETITFPGLSIGLTLPQEWRDQVTVTTGRYYDPEMNTAMGRQIYIHINRVLETQLEYHLQEYPDETPETLDEPYRDYALFIEAIPLRGIENADLVIDPYNPDKGIYLGEDENYVYTAYLPGDEGSPQARVNAQEFLISKIGEDAYNELVGDLVLTYDMVREMVTIQEPEE